MRALRNYLTKCLFAVILCAAPTGVVWAQQQDNVRQGQAVARRICAQCHAVERTLGASPNPAAPSFRSIAQQPGMTELGVYAAIRTPHSDMPRLVPDMTDLQNVIAYLLSLQEN